MLFAYNNKRWAITHEKHGKCMQNVLRKTILRDTENNIQMHLLQVVCKRAEWILRDQLRLAWLSAFIVHKRKEVSSAK